MNFRNWKVSKTVKDRYNDEKVVTQINPPGIIMSVIYVLIITTALFGSIYTVEEGHRGVVKRFSEAQYQNDPGLHFKVPIVDSIEHIEIRTRKNVEKLASATSEQMPVTAQVSVNWTVEPDEALALYKKYGGLAQFENRILDPRLRSASKTAISKYTAEQLIKERNVVIGDIAARLITQMEGFSVSLDSVQIENISLPPAYLKSIEAKQTAKNLADAEKFKLAKQKLVAQQEVNTREAEADGISLVSIAKAAAIEREGLAEAAAIKAKGASLRSNPLIVQLTHEQQWNGSLLTTSFGGNSQLLVDVKELQK